MDRETELAIVRRAYAKQTLAAARISDPRLQAAFAAVPREDFLGPGPWLEFHVPGVVPLDTADVIYVNAGVTHPVSAWLDALAGGQVMVPSGRGLRLRHQRQQPTFRVLEERHPFFRAIGMSMNHVRLIHELDSS